MEMKVNLYFDFAEIARCSCCGQHKKSGGHVGHAQHGHKHDLVLGESPNDRNKKQTGNNGRILN